MEVTIQGYRARKSLELLGHFRVNHLASLTLSFLLYKMVKVKPFVEIK